MVSLFIEFGLPHWLTFGKVLKKFLSIVYLNCLNFIRFSSLKNYFLSSIFLNERMQKVLCLQQHSCKLFSLQTT